MKKIIVIIVVLLFQVLQAQPRDIVIEEGDTLVIEPLGDSITRGTNGVTYRQYLKEFLKNVNIPTNYVGECKNAANSGSVWADYPELYNILEGDIEHDGYGGLRIDQLTDMTYNTHNYPKKTIEQLVKDNPSHIILLMIGTNDIISSYQLSTAPARLDTLISRILRSTEGLLIVSSIPPTPLPIANSKIQTLNAAMPGIVDSHKVQGANIMFIDINSMMGNEDISEDSYHPNTQGYEKIGTGFFEAITSIVTSVTEEKKNSELPTKFGLKQNYPNPFNPTTKINYSVPVKSQVSVKIYDILGNEVESLVNDLKESGEYEITFDASKLSSGIYLYRISAGNFKATKRMILLK
jgi:lysophospholipase L1-like esterase